MNECYKAIQKKAKWYESIKTTIYFFALYSILFIPFPFYLFPFQQQVTTFLFSSTITAISEKWFGIVLKNTIISSDSTALYLLVLLLFICSVLTVFLLRLTIRQNKYKVWFYTLSRQVFCYYLALQLLKYGFDKLFKSQFYLPEPNTLYTPLGQVSKDFLFWSTIGTSYSYNLFAGLAEVIPALLLPFRKTRVLGLLLATGVFIHIVVINFAFDISVKVYSLFLLLLCLLLLARQIKRLYQFLLLQKIVGLRSELGSSFFRHPFVRTAIKTFVIGVILLEASYPYAASQNFNDDLAERPFLHGAYEVQSIMKGQDTLAYYSWPLKRLFIHRNGYLIFQNLKDEMQDFKLAIDTVEKKFLLTDYQLNTTAHKYSYDAVDGKLQLRYYIEKELYTITSKVLNWRALPALQKQFHWTVEAIE